MSTRDPHTPGATRVQESRRRRPWWLWLVLALVLLVIALIALSRCGTGTGETSGAAGNGPVPTASAGSATPGGASAAAGSDPVAGSGAAASAAGAAGTDAGGSTLTAGGAPLLPLAQVAGPDGALSAQVGKPAVGNGVTVQSVPANEGFWVGTSESDRVWVQLTGTEESGYVVSQGDRVRFTGEVVAHDTDFADQVGVDAAEGAGQLTGQGAHIAVAKPDLQRAS